MITISNIKDVLSEIEYHKIQIEDLIENLGDASCIEDFYKELCKAQDIMSDIQFALEDEDFMEEFGVKD